MTDRSRILRPHHRHAGKGGLPEAPAQRETPAAAASAPRGAPDQAAEADRLRTELEAAQARAADYLATLQRTAADFANYKRRTAEDRERDLGLASESLLRKLLVVVDDFDRALEAMPAELAGLPWIEGIGLLDRKLRNLLESEGVTPIDAVGRLFDPREHEAIATVPAAGRPEGEVVAELKRGYRIRDRILRPATVAIAGGDMAAAGDPASTTN